MEPINHDFDGDICPNCRQKPASDPITDLCETCQHRLLDAVNDRLPNVDPEYDACITEKERDNETVSLGADFHLSPETMRDFIISLDQREEGLD